MGEGKYHEYYMLNEALYNIAQGDATPNELKKVAKYDLNAVTDDNPFFYKFNLGLPSIINQLLVLSFIAMIAIWLVKPVQTHEIKSVNSNLFFLSIFSVIGIAFMLIEISLFQKFILFLGHPVYTSVVLLFSLLIGAGIGSWFIGILKLKTFSKLMVVSMIIGLLVILYTMVLNSVFNSFLGDPFLIRALVSFVLLALIGFFMGMPFPLTMELLHELNLNHYVPRMWGVNGVGSVLGSVSAIAIAISYGFTYALILGSVLYLSIFIIVFIWRYSLYPQNEA